jgi:WD40 repeat protein
LPRAARSCSPGPRPESQIHAIAFTPTGKGLLSASRDRTIRVWDVGTGKELRRLLGHRGEVTALPFSPDGRVLASGSGNATALIWDWRE